MCDGPKFFEFVAEFIRGTVRAFCTKNVRSPMVDPLFPLKVSV